MRRMYSIVVFFFSLLLLFTFTRASSNTQSESSCEILPNGEEVCYYAEKSEVPSWCIDSHKLCSHWASLGECDANPKYMKENCRRSCRTCGSKEPNKYIPDPEAEEKISAYGEKQIVEGMEAHNTLEVIKKTVAYMENLQKEGTLSDKILKTCLNRDEKCSFWVAIGECEKNPSYMVTNCAPSCLSCHLIDFDTRCPVLENPTPALQPYGLNKMFERIVADWGDNVTVWLQPDMTKKEAKRDPWIITIDGFLSDEEADHLIAMGHKTGYERSMDVGKQKFDGSFEGYENTRRTSTNAWCSEKDGCRNDPKVDDIMNRISKTLNIPADNFEDFQVLRYDVGQFYRAHHDYIDHQKDRQCGPRILTFFQYLSDVEEGGGTRFPDLDLTVQPKKGRVLLWPSVLDSDPLEVLGSTRHEALPVIKGLKYAANSWIHQYNYVTPQKMGCA